MRRIGLLLLAFWWVTGCSTSEVLVAHTVPLAKATADAPEAELLDVGVKVFESGVPEGEVDKEVIESLIKEGTFVQIRRSEALYMAVVLRNTLQKSGNWGSVWVMPKETTVADLAVTAKILHSDGDLVRLRVTAKDATGRVWLNGNYEMSTAAGAFNRTRYPDLDPYQDVFNEIANDLASARDKLTAAQRRDIRGVAGMRYAADLSPDAFKGYVVDDGKGRYNLNRLPATDDPMYDRTQRVRQRERLFLDTLDQHYEKFYVDAGDSYNSWRENSREEAIEVHELTKQAHWRTGLGIATIVASVVYGNNNNGSFTDRVIRDAMMYVGFDMIRTSQVRKQEKKVHTDSLDELSSGFDTKMQTDGRRDSGDAASAHGHGGRPVSGVAGSAAADLCERVGLQARGRHDLYRDGARGARRVAAGAGGGPCIRAGRRSRRAQRRSHDGRRFGCKRSGDRRSLNPSSPTALSRAATTSAVGGCASGLDTAVARMSGARSTALAASPR